MSNVMFAQFNRELKQFVDNTKKAVRKSQYMALEAVARKSKSAIIANYPKAFKDENGVRKNKGVPKLTNYGKVDKAKLSIEISWAPNKNINFMDDQEFGGVRSGKDGGSRAMPSWFTQQQGRTATGKMKQGYSIKNLMDRALRYENRRSKENGLPKPFIMTSKSGHHMLVRRLNKKRDSVMVLYHFDKKVKIRPRWAFVKTVEGVTMHTIHDEFAKALEKNMQNG